MSGCDPETCLMDDPQGWLSCILSYIIGHVHRHHDVFAFDYSNYSGSSTI